MQGLPRLPCAETLMLCRGYRPLGRVRLRQNRVVVLLKRMCLYRFKNFCNQRPSDFSGKRIPDVCLSSLHISLCSVPTFS